MRKTAAVAVAALLLLTGCNRQSGVASGVGYASGDGATVLVAADKRGDAVALSGTTLDDLPIDVAAFRGKVVVVNFWASWCGPCRGEAATLAKVSTELQQEGVQFLGVNTRDGAAAAKAFVSHFPTGYPSIQDKDGTMTFAFGTMSPAATPTTLVLDRQGRVAARILGAVTEAQLRDVTLAVVQEK